MANLRGGECSGKSQVLGRTNGGPSTEYGQQSVVLIASEVVEVVHDGAAQMAEDEPEHGLENFFGCRRHAGRVSQVGIGSRVIVDGAGGTAILPHQKRLIQNPHLRKVSGCATHRRSQGAPADSRRVDSEIETSHNRAYRELNMVTPREDAMSPTCLRQSDKLRHDFLVVPHRLR